MKRNGVTLTQKQLAGSRSTVWVEAAQKKLEQQQEADKDQNEGENTEEEEEEEDEDGEDEGEDETEEEEDEGEDEDTRLRRWAEAVESGKTTDRQMARRYFPRNVEKVLPMLAELHDLEHQALHLIVRMARVLRELSALTSTKRFWEYVESLNRSKRAVGYAMKFVRMQDTEWEVR